MADILLRPKEGLVVLSAQEAARLLERGDGDAALLYIALLRRPEVASPRALAGELRWERSRIEAAEAVLRELGLLAPPQPAPAPPAKERRVFQREEIADALESDPEFARLATEVDRRLGRKLTDTDLSRLLGLHELEGFPADLIYLLVCHCAQELEERKGPGHVPTLYEIEKEGRRWARQGIDSQQAAAAYLRRKREALPRLMQALHLGDRPPVPREEAFLRQWHEWGFGPEAAALAYDETVFGCGKFKWEYCDKVLTDWHERGLLAPEEIRRKGVRRPKAGPAGETAQRSASGGNAWMRKYIEQREKGE